MQFFLGLAYIAVGFLQLFAIADGVGYAIGLPAFLSFTVAAFLTYIPVVGSLAGMYGAMNVWDWSMMQALLLFFWYIPIMVLWIAGGALLDRRS